MNKRHFVIIESILKAEGGLTRKEINDVLEQEGLRPLARQAFDELRQFIYKQMGVRIYARNCGKNVWRYCIDREELEDYDRLQFVGSLVANMLQSEFLREFRDLGNKIQPITIPRGNEYLRPIGTALRLNRKLCVTYQKFGEQPYDAILHPYCLKAFAGRWYLFAYKEGSEHKEVDMQNFALDRFKAITVSSECFKPNAHIDALEHFRDSFGVYVDPINHPAEDVVVACTKRVANYLRSLPLHHSQKELPHEELPTALKLLPMNGESGRWSYFSYHISVTPDFIGELNRWGNECVLLKT